jgi:hypothetical protein
MFELIQVVCFKSIVADLSNFKCFYIPGYVLHIFLNYKLQITNYKQIPNSNDQNYKPFSRCPGSRDDLSTSQLLCLTVFLPRLSNSWQKSASSKNKTRAVRGNLKGIRECGFELACSLHLLISVSAIFRLLTSSLPTYAQRHAPPTPAIL